jgi:hypothetical protein
MQPTIAAATLMPVVVDAERRGWDGVCGVEGRVVGVDVGIECEWEDVVNAVDEVSELNCVRVVMAALIEENFVSLMLPILESTNCEAFDAARTPPVLSSPM